MDSTGQFPPEYVYVATSWRNPVHPKVVFKLQEAGYDVYDFRNPDGYHGFLWGEVLPDHESCSPQAFLKAQTTERAREGFDCDYQAMQRADIFVLVLPCERDAHLELGWAVGAGKETFVLLDNPTKASLMYQMVDHVCADLDELLATLGANA